MSAMIPVKPGYYWAKLRVPADGTHEAELWGFNDTWEIVQVNANSSDWEDDPAEDEALSVAVLGVRETQWRECFASRQRSPPPSRRPHATEPRRDRKRPNRVYGR